MKSLTQIEVNFIDKAQSIALDINYVCMYLYMYVYTTVDLNFLCGHLYMYVYIVCGYMLPCSRLAQLKFSKC